MRCGIRVTHAETPRRAELRVDVASGADAVLEQARHERVDAISAFRIVRALLRVRDEAGVIDEEIHIGKPLRDAPDVGTRRMLVRARPERETLVHGDIPDTELARSLDHPQAD